MALHITKDGTLEVRAPHALPVSVIEDFIYKKQSWITKKLHEIEQRPIVAKTYNEEEEFYFLGQSYALYFVENQKTPLELTDKLCIASRHQHRAKKLIYAFYKKESAQYYGLRVQELSRQTGLIPKLIRVSSAQHRWGSCSHKGYINLSWRLMMAPKPVIDYVIIHELVHLQQHNHSRAFWQKVKSIIPDYQTHRNWLKQNGHLLNI